MSAGDDRPAASAAGAAAAITARLVELAGDAIAGLVPAADGVRDAFVRVDPARWLDVARILSDTPALAFDFLECVTAVDLPKVDRIDVVYHLFSYAHRHSLVVKCELPRAAPVLPSVASVWWAAEWNEREQFDLLGVEFSGHPDLRRLLMPDDWVGHPMRKDWQEPPAYRAMSTRRPSPIDLLAHYDKHKPGPAR